MHTLRLGPSDIVTARGAAYSRIAALTLLAACGHARPTDDSASVRATQTERAPATETGSAPAEAAPDEGDRAPTESTNASPQDLEATVAPPSLGTPFDPSNPTAFADACVVSTDCTVCPFAGEACGCPLAFDCGARVMRREVCEARTTAYDRDCDPRQCASEVCNPFPHGSGAHLDCVYGQCRFN